MSDMGEYWRDVRPAMRAKSKKKRAVNRESAANILAAADIDFQEKNGGAHLVVTYGGRTVDFWPGTGLWIERDTPKQRRGKCGVYRLIAELRSADAQR